MSSAWQRFVARLRSFGAPPAAAAGAAHATAGSLPAGWVALFHAALERKTTVDPGALASIAGHVTSTSIQALLPDARTREQLVDLLRPRAGMTARLGNMRKCGLLGQLFPELPPLPATRPGRKDVPVDRALASIGMLEGLLTGDTLPRERFGTMLLELAAPEALVIAFLVRDAP